MATTKPRAISTLAPADIPSSSGCPIQNDARATPPNRRPLLKPTTAAQTWRRELVLMPLKRPSRRPRKPAESGGERSFAEACLNGEVAPISAISGTPTVKRTPRGPGQALGPSPAPVTFRPTGRLKGVFCLAPSCLFLRGRANRPTTPIRGALQPTVAGDPWVIYRSRDFVDRDFVGDAAQRAALRCRGETAGFEQGRGLGVGNDRPRRQDRT